MTDVVTNLTKMLDLLGPNGEHWGQGSMHRSDGGIETYCLVGARNIVVFGTIYRSFRAAYAHTPETEALMRTVKRFYPDKVAADAAKNCTGLTVFNDTSEFSAIQYVILATIEAQK